MKRVCSYGQGLRNMKLCCRKTGVNVNMYTVCSGTTSTVKAGSFILQFWSFPVFERVGKRASAWLASDCTRSSKALMSLALFCLSSPEAVGFLAGRNPRLLDAMCRTCERFCQRTILHSRCHTAYLRDAGSTEPQCKPCPAELPRSSRTCCMHLSSPS